MSRPHRSPRPTPPSALAPDELLAVVADRLVEAHLAGPPAGAVVVRVRPTADGVDVDLRPVPTRRHPVEALVGTTVGPRWSAVGILCEGAARPPGDGADLPPGPGRGVGVSPPAVVLAVLVDRAGHLAQRVAARPPAAEPVGTGAPDAPEGRLVDVLRRSLGLPTAPPIAPSGPWWATLWLDRIVATLAIEPEQPRTLLGLAELHPLVGPGFAPRQATVLHRIAPGPSTAGWEVMRRAVAATGGTARSSDQAIRQALLPLVTPAQARWFDQGSFARWLETLLPPREVLLAAADALLAPAVARALHEAVRA